MCLRYRSHIIYIHCLRQPSRPLTMLALYAHIPTGIAHLEFQGGCGYFQPGDLTQDRHEWTVEIYHGCFNLALGDNNVVKYRGFIDIAIFYCRNSPSPTASLISLRSTAHNAFPIGFNLSAPKRTARRQKIQSVWCQWYRL